MLVDRYLSRSFVIGASLLIFSAGCGSTPPVVVDEEGIKEKTAQVDSEERQHSKEVAERRAKKKAEQAANAGSEAPPGETGSQGGSANQNLQRQGAQAEGAN